LTDTTSFPPAPDTFPIVGIGASAGGLVALRKFFEHVPANPGVAFVVVVHLSPDNESHLAELLQSSLKIPIQQVTATMRVETDHAYVIPPDANLESIDTHLRLSPLEKRRSERQPIDHFFQSLARTHTSNAVGVILSGTGSDGTLGLREIKQMGGFAIVQDPAEAEYDGMPRSAVISASPDLVADLKSIPDSILRLVGTHPRLGPILDDDMERKSQQKKFLSEVFSQVRSATGRDFSHYKESTATAAHFSSHAIQSHRRSRPVRAAFSAAAR